MMEQNRALKKGGAPGLDSLSLTLQNFAFPNIKILELPHDECFQGIITEILLQLIQQKYANEKFCSSKTKGKGTCSFFIWGPFACFWLILWKYFFILSAFLISQLRLTTWLQHKSSGFYSTAIEQPKERYNSGLDEEKS